MFIQHEFSPTRVLNKTVAFFLQIVAVAARDVQHAEEFARKHSIPRAYGSYDELAKDPDVGGLSLQHMAQCYGLNRISV